MNNPYEQIVNAVLDLVKKSMPSQDITYGTVVSVTPLAIKINDRATLPASFFMVSSALKGLTVNLAHTHTVTGEVESYTGETDVFPPDMQDAPETPPDGQNQTESHAHGYSHSHALNVAVGQTDASVDVFAPLAVGDRVLLLPFNSGQKYYVAERVNQ